MLGNFACFLCSLLIFLQNQNIKKKKKFGTSIPSECQTVWIQIRPHFMLGLIWVQIVCKSYQQMTLVGRVKPLTLCMLGNLALFCLLLILISQKKSSRNTIRILLGPRSDPMFCQACSGSRPL